MRIRSGLIPLAGIVTALIIISVLGAWTVEQLQPMQEQTENAYLGVRYTPMEPLGVRIDEVVTGSPAHDAGIQQGDMVYTLDGHYIDGYGLTQRISTYDVQDEITLGIQRYGEDHHIAVVLGAEPNNLQSRTELMSLNSTRDGFHLDEAVQVQPNGQWRIGSLNATDTLWIAGLREGDVITHVGQYALTGDEHMKLAASTMVMNTTWVLVEREGEALELELPSLLVRMMIPSITATPTMRAE